MSLVELFKKGPENINDERALAFSLLQTEMSVFMLQLDVEVLQVNGPYIALLPPEKEGLPERVFYTANITYHKKD
ncbi:MAG: hypothetical protein Q7S74_06225 [Nanoarchaeota archaeon]|nr:hypothetical protein [Nanoarchaeota archaeon]